MGKKSRLKKERAIALGKEGKNSFFPGTVSAARETLLERVLLNIVLFGVYAVLLTPFIISGRCFFPFVGPKSLYFMGVVEIVFFLWVYLIVVFPKYRPKLNLVSISLFSFFAVIIISSIFGVDFANSFWSKFERMTGDLMWMHLIAFFLVLYSVFQYKEEWDKIFTVSAFVSFALSIVAFLGMAGIPLLKISDRGGATLGNTSFLGTYLMFNAFLAIYLFLRKENRFWKAFFALDAFFCFFATFFSKARAATLSFLGGLALILLLYLSFKARKKIYRVLGRVLLVLSIIAVIAGVFSLFYPDSIVQKEFAKFATKSRIVVWNAGFEGFKEKPLLGWGPENFNLVFIKHFNPKIILPAYGGEVWFDRAHNIIVDTLVTTGIIGLLSYLFIFAAVFFVLFKNYLKERIDFFVFSIPIAILSAYFIQNLTVFDMVSSYMMFILILAFVAFIEADSNKGKDSKEVRESSPSAKQTRPFLGIFLVVIFLISFFKFVVCPFKTDSFVIKAMQTVPSSEEVINFAKEKNKNPSSVLKKNSEIRISLYKETLQASPAGRYQIRYYFADSTNRAINNNFDYFPKGQAEKELDFVISELKKTEKQRPLDYKSLLEMARAYSLYYMFDQSKAPLAQETFNKAIALSPRNQQAYWSLAQFKVYQARAAEKEDKKDFYEKYANQAIASVKKAIDLEPGYIGSYNVAIQIAKDAKKPQKAKEFAEKALDLVLKRIEKNPSGLQNYKDAVIFAMKAGDNNKAKEIAKNGLEIASKMIKKDSKKVSNYQLAIQFAIYAREKDKAKELAKELVNIRPSLKEGLEKSLGTSL